MTRLLLLACVLAGCVADATETASLDQALNGDSWGTFDDNAYTAGTGATANGIAISPTSHKILVAGARFETNGTSTWIVRGTADGVNWGLNHTLKILPTGSSVAYNVATDLKGTFFVVGTAVDANGATHWIVLRSLDDGATWTTMLNQGGHDVHDVPTGLSVDQNENVFVTGQALVAGVYKAKILRGTNLGATWTEVLSYSGVGAGTQNAFYGACQGTVGSLPATYATGWESASSDDGTTAMAFYTLDSGATWTETISYGALHYTRGYGCAGAPTGHLLEAAGAWQITPSVNSNWITTLWDVATHTQISSDSLTSSTSTALNASATVIHVPTPTARAYDAGTVMNSAGTLEWRTNYLIDSQALWTESDSYQYPGSTGAAQAVASAYDPVRGLYVVGRAADTTGREHGIVRHRR
jgi:hypothetical protein